MMGFMAKAKNTKAAEQVAVEDLDCAVIFDVNKDVANMISVSIGEEMPTEAAPEPETFIERVFGDDEEKQTIPIVLKDVEFNYQPAINAAARKPNCEILETKGSLVVFKSHFSTVTIDIKGLEMTEIFDKLSKAGF